MEQLACDLFMWDGKDYLVIVDRFSGYIWVHHLQKTATDNVTKGLLETFYLFGFPLAIQTDNGPQFRGPFKSFCERLGIEHITSSPYNPSSNGLAEAAVKSAKSLLQKAKGDPDHSFEETLHAWKNTPRADGLAPTDLLFGYLSLIHI